MCANKYSRWSSNWRGRGFFAACPEPLQPVAPSWRRCAEWRAGLADGRPAADNFSFFSSHLLFMRGRGKTPRLTISVVCATLLGGGFVYPDRQLGRLVIQLRELHKPHRWWHIPRRPSRTRTRCTLGSLLSAASVLQHRGGFYFVFRSSPPDSYYYSIYVRYIQYAEYTKFVAKIWPFCL